MKRFNEYLNEDFDPAIYNHDGSISIDDPTVVDAINSNLEASTSCVFRTPYNALEEVRKVLSYYKIFLPKSVFLDQNHGNDVFEISQFGEKMGMNDQGEVVTASDSPLFVYFEWSLNEKGMYDAFASVVSEDELQEIMDDYDSEVEDDETDLTEEHSMGAHSKMLYKLVNRMKAQKQSDDVDAYIEHEKQGKTYTQMCEEPMPDLKKKMGAKKVTLSNMMKKEETQLNEGRPSQRHALKDHSYHKKSNAELQYIIKDAGQAAEAMKGHSSKAENKYRDQLNDASTILNFRKTSGMPNWYKKKYGHDKAEKVSEEKAPFKPTETPSTPYEKPKNKSGQLARAAMRAEIQKGKEEKKRLRKSLREK
jgi:hypothetical protein